jgi:hypothetical protein
MKADLVAEETDGARAERGAKRAIDGGERGANDCEPGRRRDAPAADELDRESEPLHLLGDLRPGAVNDADAVSCLGELKDQLARLVRDRAAALEDDEAHERYSALIRT